MLKKTASADGKDWDKLLPNVLFAYRKVPQESARFSPFELLYGWEVRGPLDVLKEEWEASPSIPESVVSHILQMRERLQHTTALVHKNIGMAQRQQMQWYDQTARECTLDPGDQFLVLLPTSTLKLLAQWQGLYKVLQQVGLVNYLIEMTGRQKRQYVFHINMFKRWNTPLSSGYWVAETAEVEGELQSWTWDGGEDGEPTVGAQLTEQQRGELMELYSNISGHSPKKRAVLTSQDTASKPVIAQRSDFLPTAYHMHTASWYSRSWRR